jgi:hypothetical protein
MIQDKLTLVSDDQDLSQTAGTYYSDVLNFLGDAGYTTSQDAPSGITHDIGKGHPVPLDVAVNETFTSGGAATLTVSLETDDNEAFSSATTLFTSRTFALAELVSGARLLPEHMPYGCEQYVRIAYVIATATTTAGTVTASIGSCIQSNK